MKAKRYIRGNKKEEEEEEQEGGCDEENIQMEGRCRG